MSSLVASQFNFCVTTNHKSFAFKCLDKIAFCKKQMDLVENELRLIAQEEILLQFCGQGFIEFAGCEISSHLL